MKRNLYFTTIGQRRNPIKDALLNFFLSISSYPKLLIEVFIRRDMGARYFNLFPVTILALFLLFFPFLPFLNQYNNKLSDTIKDNWGWYLFTAAFIVFSYFRNLESKHKPDKHDSRYSLSAGKLLPFVKNIKFGQTSSNIRMLEIFVEPVLVFLVAVLFIILDQWPIGLLLICCAIIYCLSYIGTYSQGDDFVFDKIDGMLCTQDMSDAFIHNVIETASGFRFYGYKPESKILREELYNTMLVDADYVSEVTKA
ncbi:hypothetical protein F0919_17010 [Taibaiella lutea]|uniref:Uncharacterized protein n=1 Tax=Taibaiella lutea TaxID=2608001 RepID=A0A5M6CBG7_9BACT|nr:hypothetical protein [Taibaiella lutea]KAA5532484.1 hypothetical protein F0919_17010 [Taibaiella lutea]